MSARQPTGFEQQIAYALSRKVPDMAHGFRIETSYGEIEIAPGPLADKICAIVRESLKLELAALEQ